MSVLPTGIAKHASWLQVVIAPWLRMSGSTGPSTRKDGCQTSLKPEIRFPLQAFTRQFTQGSTSRRITSRQCLETHFRRAEMVRTMSDLS